MLCLEEMEQDRWVMVLKPVGVQEIVQAPRDPTTRLKQWDAVTDEVEALAAAWVGGVWREEVFSLRSRIPKEKNIFWKIRETF